MPQLTTDDGVKLHYEEVGSGIPIVFVHEFAGDIGAWEGQLRQFVRRYRAIAYNARGYPPSDVPDDVARYSQDRARDDIRAVLDALSIDKAHVVGLSMGGFATLHFGFTYPERARSLVIGGCGYGAEPGKRAPLRGDGHGRGRQGLWARTGACAAPEQGPARLAAAGRRPCPPLRARLGADAARRAGPASVTL
jgi:pimeloyl-ACP methyl ester carboxylesterase